MGISLSFKEFCDSDNIMENFGWTLLAHCSAGKLLLSRSSVLACIWRLTEERFLLRVMQILCSKRKDIRNIRSYLEQVSDL